MILILTKNNDGSSNRIIDWLCHYGKKFIRVNGNDESTKIIEINSNQILIEQNGAIYDLLQCDSLWYRRNSFSTLSFGIKMKNSVVENVLEGDRDYAKKQLLSESNVLVDYLHYLIESHIEKRFGGYFTTDVNKLIVLEKAEKIGLKITTNFILSAREKLYETIQQNGNLITKALDNGVYAIKKKHGYYSYTERVNLEDVDRFSNSFFPSLLQKEIKKKYELRVFFLAGRFYSTVIFSQKNKTTSIDSRKHSKDPSRTLPYQLPEEIENKLSILMRELGLNMGSIDIIVDQQGEYVFLEVNPVGQFSFYSNKCNYHLERELARLL